MTQYLITLILCTTFTIGFGQDLKSRLDEAFRSNDLAALDQIKQEAIQDEDKLTLAEAYYRIGYIEKKEGHFFNAVVNYQEAIKAYREIGEYKQLSSVLIHLAETYNLSGLKQTALDYYNDVVSLKIQLNDSIGLRRAYYNLGQLYKNLDNLDTALIYYDQSLQLATVIDKNFIGRIYNDMGILHRKLEKYDEARRYYDLADQYDTSVVMQARTLNNRAHSYMEEGNKVLALQYLKQALKLDTSKVQARTLTYIYSNLSEVHPQQDSALYFYKKSFQYVQEKPQLSPDELQRIFNLNEALNKSNDSLDVFTKELVSSQTELMVQSARYQVEAATLKVEKDSQTEELEAQNRLLLYAFAGLLLTSIGLLVYFFQVRKHKKKEQHIIKRAKEVYDILKS